MSIAMERGYRYEVTDIDIRLSSDTGVCVWSGAGVVSLIATLNDGGDHLLVCDFENTTGTTWRLKTSVDGNPFVDQGLESGCQVAAVDTEPRVELSSAESDSWVDEATMWVNNSEFTSQNLQDLFDLGETGQPGDGFTGFTTTTTLGVEPHPADTGPGTPNFRIDSSEILAYANAFLTDDGPTFPGISPSNRSAYVLRGAAIHLENFQSRYEDVGTAEPVDSTAHPARWQELPDI